VPILKHSPDPVDLGGVQINESANQTISFTNIGVSVARIKNIELVSADGFWTLSDANEYPVEIHDGDWAFTYNGTGKLDVDVSFTPVDIGASRAQLHVTWGLYEDLADTFTEVAKKWIKNIGVIKAYFSRAGCYSLVPINIAISQAKVPFSNDSCCISGIFKNGG